MSVALAKARPMAFRITDECVGCGSCRKKCPWGAISGEKKCKHVIDPTLCQQCGTCWYACPKRAIEDAEGYRRRKGERARVPKARIDAKACAGCQNCLLNCEQDAIEFESGLVAGHCRVDKSKCIGCGNCLAYCASGCIEFD